MAQRGDKHATWGLVATIKTRYKNALNFVAHHLDLGADRIFIYLDTEAPRIQAALETHPKVQVTLCDRSYWQTQNDWRPVKHQVRQAYNATYCYADAPALDWLGHIDVDEFLWPEVPIAQILGALAPSVRSARIRPIELLSGSDSAFKAAVPNGPDQADRLSRIYPTYGHLLQSGFLSHKAGKLFARTGRPNIDFKIHNIEENEIKNPQQTELSNVLLCHAHAQTWEKWRETFAYRLDKGAYRSELGPQNMPGKLNLHQLFQSLEAEGGEEAVRAFFQEVAADGPDLRARLHREGLLHLCALDLDRKRRRHFPQS